MSDSAVPRTSQESGARPCHISVCICTYKRPEMLARLLKDLSTQETGGRFTYSAVVVDNDQSRSAEAVVLRAGAESSLPIRYVVESRQNIPLARNKAVENAVGNFLCFIDDDEFPTRNWLLTLYQACEKYGADGVLGPVKPYFDERAPRWVVKGGFYDRQSHPTGLVIGWRMGRTGNTFLRRRIFEGLAQPFQPEFRVGEDQDFFRRMIDKGHVFVWCEEAVAYEVVPPIRWNRSFMLKRALLRGRTSLEHPTFGIRDIATSAVAMPTYALALPFAFCLGQSAFMNVLIRLFDHAGRLLALLGINPIKQAYVTE